MCEAGDHGKDEGLTNKDLIEELLTRMVNLEARVDQIDEEIQTLRNQVLTLEDHVYESKESN